MDGNRRWARQAGFQDATVGYRYGAQHLDEVLRWYAEIGIQHVTAYVASVDNLRKREPKEVDNLLRTIEEIVAARLTPDQIVAHLYTSGQPDPDLVIRTSGERRMSGFLLWQAAYSELCFCDVYWPGFRKVDFLRALRSYAARQRRFGG